MIDPKASKQPKPNTFYDLKTIPSKMATMLDTARSQELIRARAYELYESRGREPGQDEQDWFRAEQEILNQVDKQKGYPATRGSARRRDSHGLSSLQES